MAFAVAGIVLLFFARVPLYKQRKFFTFGSKALRHYIVNFIGQHMFSSASP
jgi:hypothetical protein